MMAKWSNIYLDDSLKLLKKVEKRLKNEVERTDLTENLLLYLCESKDDLICFGRRELAKELQAKIKKWRREMFNEEGEK
tara:strand:+ start:248 stop:484 length:237 start_codon:yes stop_codon:yes gene_type:complete